MVMAASLTAGAAQLSAARVERPFSSGAARRPQRSALRLAVRAQAEGEDAPRLSFQSNERAGRGFTDEDSAGQTNIFAVEPKTYVQGSAGDTTTGSAGNTIAAAGAAVLGLGAIVVGLLVQKPEPAPVSTEELAQYKPLSAYAAQFAKEARPAPAVASE